MAPGPHETSGSLSSNDSTAKLIPTCNSCSCIAVDAYGRQTHSTLAETPWGGSSTSSTTIPKVISHSNSCIKHSFSSTFNTPCAGHDTILFHNELNSSVSSHMLYGDGERTEVFNSNTVVDYDHQIDEETFYREESVSNVTDTTSSRYCYVEEHPYASLIKTDEPINNTDEPITKTPKPRTFPPVCLWVSFSIGLVAISFVAIFSVQYLKSLSYVYKYENCTLCADVAEDDKQFISYLRRLGDLKYCCFKSSRDPVYRLNKAVEKAFAPSIKAKQLKLNRSIEINGTDAAMVLTLKISSVSKHFKDNEKDLPMRKLIPLSCGIKIKNDQLLIQQPGRYFILSQYYHKLKYDKESLKRAGNVIGHDIHRANVNLPNDGRDQLLVHFYTARAYSPYTDYHVSYVAGIFQLEKNDKVYVGVTHNNSTGYSDSSGNRLSLIFLGNQTERVGYI